MSLIRLTAAALLLAAAPAAAEPAFFATPHVSSASGPESVVIGGQTYVNHGLVAVGRLAASTRDFAGETLGSFSGMAVERWSRRPDGTYAGRIMTLPDRGPNDVGPFKGTTDYRNRIHLHDVVLAPARKSLTIKPAGGFLLTDATGANFTGKDAGANILRRDGIAYPSPAEGEGAGHVSLDSEALARLPDGSFYISDEYGPGIYYFDRTGRQVGAIQAPEALLPRVDGAVNMAGGKAPQSGRRNNQGLEALAVTPDGTRLVAMLQSATVQDAGKGAPTRNNARLLVYDISATRTPRQTIGHYVVQLPTFSAPGVGGAATATAAQSEMVALSPARFLVLSRDNLGRGAEPNEVKTAVYKSVLLVDVTAATNLAGTPYETGPAGAVSPGGVPAPSIAPAIQAELVNMLNPGQLAARGLNIDTAPTDAGSLSEKWESMALVPALDPAAPGGAFLLVGNDNDFVAAKGRVGGKDFDASLTGDKGRGEHDNLILVYRLSLPTAPTS